MKILVHGATNGSNFGDCLFAHIFYEKLNVYGDVDFLYMPRFGMCDYLINEIVSYKRTIYDYKKADCLVYMSGGYFGDTTSSFTEAIKRYFRYFRVAEYFIKKNKPIYVCGVGGGPINNPFLRKKIVRILNYAKKVTVRDYETAEYFKSVGVYNKIIVTTDTALTVREKLLPNIDEKLDYLLSEKKNIFLHVYGTDKSNEELTNKILPSINKFLLKFPEKYRVFVCTDNITKKNIEDLEIFQKLEADKVPLKYRSTWEFCSLLKRMDSVITVKLHVGIVASLFGRSVVSFPKHINKTKRFYNQIGYGDRCKLLKDCDENDTLCMIEKYIENPIHVNDELVRKAKLNLSIFDE